MRVSGQLLFPCVSLLCVPSGALVTPLHRVARVAHVPLARHAFARHAFARHAHARHAVAPRCGVSDALDPEAKVSNGLVLLALSSSALASEATQLFGTFALLKVLQAALGAADLSGTVAMVIAGSSALGWPLGLAIYTLLQLAAQVVPVFSALTLTIACGAAFGTLKATLAMSIAYTLSAAVCFGMARRAEFGAELASITPQIRTINLGLANARDSTSTFLMALLRLNPLLPFTWANYLFGLSRVKRGPFLLGTWVGTLPVIFFKASAGALGASVLHGSTKISVRGASALLGISAAAVYLMQRVSRAALIDLEAS